LLVVLLPLLPLSYAQSPPAYKNPNLPIETRVNDLISRMKLEEKVLQMQNAAPAIERLGVPAYDWWNEALHGVARAGYATVFPQAIGLAATWDTKLMYEVADVISTEARAKHHEFLRNNQHARYEGLTFWSPNINIFRDPRWGRGQETYGEDPYLTARLGVEFVKGLQGNDPRYFKVIATPKHYAVHSGPEPSRHTIDVKVRRANVEVRARKGYWAYTADDAARATAPPKAGPPPAISNALNAIVEPSGESLGSEVSPWKLVRRRAVPPPAPSRRRRTPAARGSGRRRRT
jgi:beta-glucosidase-like glycosyl hydrolase